MIDIIIPAYNANDFIYKTLMSICMQTIKDKLVVYIIDDCSKKDYDKEVKIFSKFIKIKSIKTKKNSGPGAARQFGMDNSNSKYIMFIDSDDMFYNMYSLEKLLDEAENGNYDYVVGKMLQQNTFKNYEYSSNKHPWCLHAKLYRRDFIEKYKIRFNNTYNNEDYAFNQLVLLCNPNKKYLEEDIYCYVNNCNSITRSKSDYKIDTYDTYVYNMIWVFKEAEKRNVNVFELSKFVANAFGNSYYLYCKNINSSRINEVLLKTKELYNYYKKYKNNIPNNIRYNILISKFENHTPIITITEFINKIINM